MNDETFASLSREGAGIVDRLPSTVGRFVKRPVEVEALKFDGGNSDEILVWVAENGGRATYRQNYLYITTMEGDMLVTPGDYVIKGTRGEFYPCKPGPFADTFARLA